MIRLLQVCNVGEIRGGTGACAWSVTRALPDFHHEVWSLTEPNLETIRAFAPIPIRRPGAKLDQEIRASTADLVLLHNISRQRLSKILSQPTLNYLHSKINPAPAQQRVVCSEYLNQLYGGKERVLWQGVPRATRPELQTGIRELRKDLIVGRLCTPTDRKWWPDLPEFYGKIATELPDVRFEFIGCPERLQKELQYACQGRSKYAQPGWNIRSKLWTWDVLLYHHPTLPETFGRTVAEACRAGCIPVVDRRGGFVEQLAGEGGLLCDNVDEFIESLRFLRDPAVRWKRSRACRSRAEERFSLTAFRARLLKEFRQLLTC
jgi:glycosyltransferase involved in cell wall biosynthesis